jgi:hypothetical protein
VSQGRLDQNDGFKQISGNDSEDNRAWWETDIISSSFNSIELWYDVNVLEILKLRGT